MNLAELRNGIICKSELETIQLAESLIPLIPEDFVIALSGDLGAGKTTFAKGLAKGLGISRIITSPTYNIYSLYNGSRRLIHMDAYRLNVAADLDAIGINDSLKTPYLVAVEWPENVEDWIQEQSHWWFQFSINKTHHHQIRLIHEIKL